MCRLYTILLATLLITGVSNAEISKEQKKQAFEYLKAKNSISLQNIFVKKSNRISLLNNSKALSNTLQNTSSIYRLDSVIVGDMVKEYIEYDENFLPIFSIDETYNEETQTWDVERVEYNYNSLNQITLAITSDWDYTQENWLPSYTNEYEYNENGKVSKQTSYNYDFDVQDWVLTSIRTITYNNGKIITEITEEYGDFLSNTKTEYTYNENDWLMETNSFQWDTNLEEWVLNSTTLNLHDDSGNILESTIYNNIFDTVRPITKTTFEYDQNNNNTVQTVANWNEETEEFVNFMQTAYEFDLLVDKSSIATFGNEEYPFNNKLDKFSVGIWIDIIEMFIPFIEADLHYSIHQRTSVENEFSQNNSFFPNPSQGIVNFNSMISNVEVYNAYGELMINTNNSLNLDLDGFANGVYTLKLKPQDGKTKVEKLILAK